MGEEEDDGENESENDEEDDSDKADDENEKDGKKAVIFSEDQEDRQEMHETQDFDFPPLHPLTGEEYSEENFPSLSSASGLNPLLTASSFVADDDVVDEAL